MSSPESKPRLFFLNWSEHTNKLLYVFNCCNAVSVYGDIVIVGAVDMHMFPFHQLQSCICVFPLHGACNHPNSAIHRFRFFPSGSLPIIAFTQNIYTIRIFIFLFSFSSSLFCICFVRAWKFGKFSPTMFNVHCSFILSAHNVNFLSFAQFLNGCTWKNVFFNLKIISTQLQRTHGCEEKENENHEGLQKKVKPKEQKTNELQIVDSVQCFSCFFLFLAATSFALHQF